MPRFIFRDRALLPEFQLPAAIEADDPRFSAMSPVDLIAQDPAESAARVAAAGPNPYLRFILDGPVDFPDHVTRRAFWRTWTEEFVDRLPRIQGVICLDHPTSLGWDHERRMAVRHWPEYQAFFVWMIDLMGTRAEHVSMFGVRENSPVLYEVPMPPNLGGAARGQFGSAWVNLPGQYAFNGRTTRHEFRAFLAICRALEIPNVLLWSNPAERERDLAEHQMPWVFEQIEATYPAPVEIEPAWWMQREGELFDDFVKRLSEAAP